MKKNTLLALGLSLIATVALFDSCVKKDFDAPTDNSTYDPNLPVNATIAQVKALTNSDSIGTDGLIKADLTIAGVVVMDDRSGNYYKQLVIQDSTGGIEIELDKNNLYNDYPVGRKIYVHLKGLYLGNYHNLPQLGYTPDATGAVTVVPIAMIDDYVVKASYPNEIKADTLTYAQLMTTTSNQQRFNTLVVIKDVQFSDDARGVAYSNASASTSRGLMDCDNTQSKIVLRTSNYADFSTYLTPTGKGYITGIYTVYNTTPQLAIRDTTDVQFYGEPCGGSGGGSGSADTVLSEGFSSAVANAAINISGWTNFAETGGKYYTGPTTTLSNPYAMVTAYQSGQSAVKSWLVTPALNLTGLSDITLSFRYINAFCINETFSVWVTTSFNGNPAASTWDSVGVAITKNTGNYAASSWKTVTASLAAYAGQTVYVAFKYEGADPGATGTYELDDVKVYGN